MNWEWFKEHLEKRSANPIGFISTNIKKLDMYVDGYYPGTLWTVGAWPGVGKTTLMLNLLKELKGVPVSIFDTETDKSRLMEKFVSLLSGIPDKDIRTKFNDNYEDIKKYVEKMDCYNFNINDKSCPTYFDIENEVKNNRPRILIIDYFQNIDVSYAQNRYGAYTDIARKLETLTKQFNMTTIMCSQLRRPSEEVVAPTIFDLKETGKLAEMPHVIIMLSQSDSELVIDVAKNRSGSKGTFKLRCDWACNRLYDLKPTTRNVKENTVS